MIYNIDLYLGEQSMLLLYAGAPSIFFPSSPIMSFLSSGDPLIDPALRLGPHFTACVTIADRRRRQRPQLVQSNGGRSRIRTVDPLRVKQVL